tara:strand:+ start:426 stop:755 length:330 start_codon:yes stop_codon:yes gene_type:complete
MSLPTASQLTALYSSFCKTNNTAYFNNSNRVAQKLSIISAEVDDMVNHPVHPHDTMHPPNNLSYYTDHDTYHDPTSWDEDYEEYNDGYPSDAEDIEDCMVSSDDDDNFD